ncbi:MAG TPA: hypothetical protein VNQ73_00550 [Ilumatobacter sp.]|nr:hypothetical protein [Ilumatobacter sp.]
MRGFRSFVAALAGSLLVAGCANPAADTDAAATSAAAPVTVGAGSAAVTRKAVSVPAATTAVPTTVPEPEPYVSVDVEIGPSTTVVAAPAAELSDADGDALAEAFGAFAACSGLRESVANWSLQVSNPGHDITAVSILAVSPVAGPGTVDGSFRVEFVNGAALDGTGTVTLDPGLQSGTFSADDADLRGAFACTGAPEPELLPSGATGVEVFALVRQGAAERMLSLTEPYAAGGTECAGRAGRVQVTGDAGLGAPVELTIEGDALVLTVGGTDVPVDPGHTRIQIDGRSGTFHAVTTDGYEIDGAFTCT